MGNPIENHRAHTISPGTLAAILIVVLGGGVLALLALGAGMFYLRVNTAQMVAEKEMLIAREQQAIAMAEMERAQAEEQLQASLAEAQRLENETLASETGQPAAAADEAVGAAAADSVVDAQGADGKFKVVVNQNRDYVLNGSQISVAELRERLQERGLATGPVELHADENIASEVLMDAVEELRNSGITRITITLVNN